MKAEAANRATGVVLMGATMLAYVARPWSCGLTLSKFSPDDPVPYSYFDYHGWGTIFAWALALLFAAPIFWLAARIFLDEPVQLGVFGRGRDSRTTIASILIALGLGAPMYTQLAYIAGLPLSVASPIVVSSMIWLFVVELGRTAAVRGTLSTKAIRFSVALALLIVIPKAALFSYSLTQP